MSGDVEDRAADTKGNVCFMLGTRVCGCNGGHSAVTNLCLSTRLKNISTNNVL